jgi:hypothetical protein
MAQQTINLGATGTGGGGDTARLAFEKIIANFDELYAEKAPLASPAFTGTPTVPTPAVGSNDASAANTAFVQGIAANKLDTTGTAADASKLDGRAAADFWHTSNLVKQTSPTDTTAGALMAVGAFGLGANAKVTAVNIDDPVAVPKGLVFCSGPSGTTGTLPTPYGILWSGGISNDGFAQEWYEVGTGATTKRHYYRTMYNGVLGPWRELYHTGNILGTVSQSGGVPTGAIIERGSNANGEYVRYADGTQICLGVYRTLVYGSTTVLQVTEYHAASFINANYITVWNSDLSTEFLAASKRSGIHDISSRSTAACVLRFVGGGSFVSGDVMGARALSIGRWY